MSLSHFDFKAHMDDKLPRGIAVTFTPGFPLSLPLVLARVLERLPRHWHVAIITLNDEHLATKEKFIEMLWKHNPAYEQNGKYVHVYGVLPKTFNINQYSCYLQSPKFYASLPASHVLIFQMDTILLRQDDYRNDIDRSSNSNKRRYYLRDFFEFPFVGAPWGWQTGCAKDRRVNDTSPEYLCPDTGNGGFSLRKKSAMFNITNDENFRKMVKEDSWGCHIEDMTFTNFLRHHPFWHSKLPTRPVGRAFAMETLAEPDPVGTHKPWYMPNWGLHPDVRVLEQLVMKHNEEVLYKWMFSEDGKVDPTDLGRGPIPPYPREWWERFLALARVAPTKQKR